jgi:MFS family permease
MAVVAGLITDKVGVAWTFRIFGLATLATGVPTALCIRERVTARKEYSVDFSLFKDRTFVCLFMSGAIGVFAIYIPSFFLPYVAQALGLSNSTTTGVIACFNVCMAIGRIASGVACDKLGSFNTYLFTMLVNAVTFFAIWSTSSTLATLLAFAIINGIANGAFFVAMPTAVGKYLGNSKATSGISLALTGWGPGLLVGNPIAGVLIDVTGADKADSIVPFRPVGFYAGGTALISAGFIVFAYVLTKKTRAHSGAI